MSTPTGTTVLHVVASTDRRGAEVFASKLNEALSAKGWPGQVVALAPGVTQERLEVPTLGPGRRSPATFRGLRRIAARSGLVVAHGSTTLPLCAIGLAGSGRPFVYRNIGDPTHWGTSRLRRLRSKVFLRRAAAVVALTPATARQLVDIYEVPQERVRAIPRGVPAEDFPLRTAQRRVAARQRFGLPVDAPLVVYLGAMSPEKRPDVAVAAVCGMDGTHLALFGDGSERGTVERLAAEAPGRIHMMGSTPEPAMALAAADVLVVPSQTEGLPGVLIEAGLTGIPVVASDVGYVREIVADGCTGRLVPPGDVEALRHALAATLAEQDPGLPDRARARSLAEFSLEQVAEKWSALLSDVLSEVSPSSSS